MHVLEADGWTEGFLDATPVGGQRRVHVEHQVALFRADGQYFVRERDLAMLWSYARALGVPEGAAKGPLPRLGVHP